MLIGTIMFGGIILSKKKLVIFDKDEKYARSLMEYLHTKQDFPYTISVFSDEAILLEYSLKTEIHLLLVSESAYAEIKDAVKAERIMILNESGELAWKDLQNIKKYQSADHIVQEIMHYYVEVEKVFPMKMTLHVNTKIIGFFSPIRRCSQTTMGLTLGQIMAEKCRTLYLNFESLSGFSHLLGYSGGKELSDLMFFLETAPERFGIHLKSCVKKLDNLDYIPPMSAMHQLLLINAETWQRLIEALVEEGGYEVIILDLSEGMQGLFEILRMCTHVYTLTKDDRYAQAKVEQYEQLLQVCDYDDVLKKTLKRRIPFMREIPNAFSYQPGAEYSRFIKNMLKEDGIYA